MTNDRRHAVREWFDHHRRGTASLPLARWDDAPGQPRVLVECDDDAVSWAMAKTLERSGFEVATCPGPSSSARCALIESGRCDLQAGADVIVNCMNSRASDVASLVPRTVEAHPECPLIVDSTAVRQSEGALPAGVSVLVSPWNGPKLVDVVDEAAGRADHSRPGSS